jgi:hypothetical protein
MRSAFIAAAAAAAALAAIAVALYTLRPEPGLYLDFRFHSPTGADETGRLAAQNVSLCVFARVVTPEGSRPLAGGCFKGIPVVKIPYDAIKKHADRWREHLRSMGVPEELVDRHQIGLIVDAILLNRTSRAPIYTAHDSIPLTLGDFKRPQAVYYVARVARGRPQVEAARAAAWPARAVAAAEARDPTCDGRECYCYGIGESIDAICWIPVAWSGPENLTSALPPDYFTSQGGVLYVKTPVLVVYNNAPRAGARLGSAVLIYSQTDSVVARLTYSTGQIISALRQGSWPGVNLFVGSAVWGGQRYGYSRYLPPLDPGGQWWAYIWARPITELYQTYLCYYVGADEYSCYYYMYDELDAYISSVLISGVQIQGGGQPGLPHSALMSSFFGGVQMQQLVVPGTVLDDGRLDPGESITLQLILQSSDKCSAGFDVGVPVGALVGMALCSALAPEYAPACRAFLGGIVVSFGYQSSSWYIDGVLDNIGSDYMYVYMAASRLTYATPSGCTYGAPAGLYFEAR